MDGQRDIPIFADVLLEIKVIRGGDFAGVRSILIHKHIFDHMIPISNAIRFRHPIE